MRISFYEAFHDNGDGTYSPLTTIKIGGAIVTPGIDFTSDAWFGDIEIAKYIGRDLEVEHLQDGTMEIKRFC
ncbi:MAG: hypothetical protein AB1442_05955 [Nitrospirota bacterium]